MEYLPTVWITSGRIPEREKSVIYERLQNAALSTVDKINEEMNIFTVLPSFFEVCN